MRVRVPATIANLGPGFDVLAMAVDIWLEVEAAPSASPEWSFSGEGAGWLPGTDHPFSPLAMRGTIANGIPVGAGLGSSAAARLAALALRGVTGRELLARAAAGEGHADNAAAAIHGGVVAVVGGEVHRLPAPRLDVALFLPEARVPTTAARAILPTAPTREDSVFTAGRLALLVSVLHTRRWSLLSTALEDRIHQPHRALLYPWLPDAITAALAAGAHGAALSGAGPAVMAFVEPGRGEAVAAAMAAAAAVPGRVLVTRTVRTGMRVGR